jgi:hypothetical protein
VRFLAGRPDWPDLGGAIRGQALAWFAERFFYVNIPIQANPINNGVFI